MTAETLNAQLASIYQTYTDSIYAKEWEDNVYERSVAVTLSSPDQTSQYLLDFSRTEISDRYPEEIGDDKSLCELLQ